MLRCALCTVALWSALPAIGLAMESPAAQLKRLLDESWEFDLREDPVFATQTGDVRYNAQLADESLAAIERRAAVRRQFLARLNQIDRAALAREDQINYDIFGRLLRDALAEFDLQTYLTPITGRSGFHIEFPDLQKQVPLNHVQDYENYIARLAAFERLADQQIDCMRQGIKQGMTVPAVVLEGYQDSVQPHLTEDVAKSLFYEPLTRLPERIGPGDQARLGDLGRQAIASHVVPGYRKFLEFLRDEYVPAARTSIAASALPQGRQLYRHRVKRFTTLDLAPEQVHQTGLAEVKRIREEMQGVLRRVKFQGDFAAFVQHLRTDTRFYPETAEQLLKETSHVLKKIDGQLPKLFATLPRLSYGIREVPSYIAPRTTTAYYMPGAGDGSRAGFYYVNTHNLKSRPLFEIEALSLHEAVPGHHLQIARQQELTALPPFRRYADITAFIEGWGLYSERLGLEMGLYQDPYSDFGRLSYEMWRACRLVVDTGLHYLGWSREQAIDYMAQNSALSLHNIRAEVDRYIAWPGQALAYKTGELKIRELRRLAEEQLGERFDVRKFHDVVLGSGAVPLDVLADNVRDYIQQAEPISQSHRGTERVFDPLHTLSYDPDQFGLECLCASVVSCSLESLEQS